MSDEDFKKLAEGINAEFKRPEGSSFGYRMANVLNNALQEVKE